ncbi:MAG: hypothetical protein HOQ28_14640 [Thermoleophilia bacterium]|nr:hypothetical protein [Thermoleophilia bacterium]
MRSRITASISCASALAAVALLAPGCGAHKASGLSDCEVNAENRAAFNVVRDAFNSGNLGTADQLATHFKGVKRSRYLDASGKLRTFDRLMSNPTVSYDTLIWVNGLQGTVGRRAHDAKLQVRNSGSANCD